MRANRGRTGPRWAALLVLVVAALALSGCGVAPPPEPTPRPPPLPTRAPPPSPTALPTETPAPPSPTAAPPRVFTEKDFDPYWPLYSTERDGRYVTTRNPRGRYYYRWDDRRWYALEDRIWFRSIEDLLTVYPSRSPAP